MLPDNITGANNFRTNYTEKLTRDAYLIKGDHALSDKDRISMRYMYNSDNLDYSTVMTDIAAENRIPAIRHQNFFYGTYTRVFSPSVINEFRFNYGNRINHTRAYGLGGNWPSKLGLKGVPDDAFPTFAVTGYRTMGGSSHERRQFPIQQFMYSDNLSIIRGRHSMKFGFEYRPSYNYEINRPSVSGSFTMSPLTTGQPGTTASGYGMASLLVGAPLNMSVRETEILDRQSNYIAFFAQDDWTVTRDLTLNIGVRWETDTPIKDYSNRMNGFESAAINPVSGTPGVIKFMGVDGYRTSPYDTDYNNFGPRFGFAWKPGGDSKTVIRGGFGTFFAHPFDAGAPTAASLGFELVFDHRLARQRRHGALLSQGRRPRPEPHQAPAQRQLRLRSRRTGAQHRTYLLRIRSPHGIFAAVQPRHPAPVALQHPRRGLLRRESLPQARQLQHEH